MEKIQGSTFKAMLESGANNLSNNYQMIDALNVFPVPDGDTGTNMSLTYNNVVKELNNCLENDFASIRSVFMRDLSISIMCRIAFIMPSERNQPSSISNHHSAAPLASQNTKSRYSRLMDSSSVLQAESDPGKFSTSYS